MSTIRIMAFAGDEPMVEYVRGLGYQLRTVRRRWYSTERGDPLKIEVRTPGTATEALEALRAPADLIVFAAHGGFSDDGVAWVGEDVADTGRWINLDCLRGDLGGLRCHGLVLDACSNYEEFAKRVEAALDQRAAYLGCDGKNLFTHGPVLVWDLLARLTVAQNPAIDAQGIDQAARAALEAAGRVLQDGDAKALKRWSVRLLG
ncbi:hypothetical protein AB0F71_01855 [Kitasatospora sp. NPDC028055]|uniref:hypothetical protein n=1 Tax=Kitasatospora sp. NPDC028055 TaxID=3155653 RepID=UPI0033C3E1C1